MLCVKNAFSKSQGFYNGVNAYVWCDNLKITLIFIGVIKNICRGVIK